MQSVRGHCESDIMSGFGLIVKGKFPTFFMVFKGPVSVVALISAFHNDILVHAPGLLQLRVFVCACSVKNQKFEIMPEKPRCLLSLRAGQREPLSPQLTFTFHFLVRDSW